jgi:hypothetical protein
MIDEAIYSKINAIKNIEGDEKKWRNKGGMYQQTYPMR